MIVECNIRVFRIDLNYYSIFIKLKQVKYNYYYKILVNYQNKLFIKSIKLIISYIIILNRY